MKSTLVLNVVGLTPGLISEHTPALAKFRSDHAARALTTITPAVTCSVQSTFVTGLLPSDHGIVGNGWYFRDLSQVWLWRQSNQLVAGEKIWEAAKRRDSSFSCAKLFWWYNMYSRADISLTPRPMYTADGRKIPDVYSDPPELRDELTRELGQFPLFNFWGPRADISSSRWIARATERVIQKSAPTLTLVYLPHLDYDLQRFGPGDPRIRKALTEVDELCAGLFDLAKKQDLRVVVLSEYGITGVSAPIHVNRALREAGLLRVREELGLEQLDAGASRAFAVADHQVAHVYVKDPGDLARVSELCRGLDGVEHVLDAEGKRKFGLLHDRSGELVLIARKDRWFSYYFWLDDARAPDYARTVDIHNKPGYDPVELFINPALALPMLTVGRKLLARKLGFRSLLDVIALDGSLVKGSHGRVTDDEQEGPLFMSSVPELLPEGAVPAVAVKDLLLRHIFD
ncbi:MAG TPA: nucleotide pyrophosphatase/phosphodiesterase family protein [Polyangiaceae bacterium]|nr:nucleotide pyrophosphatase/phosphodiesterase family protein [Polyangiaceae bacterium]